MVEVFKTNVSDQDQAKWLVDKIHGTFAGYQANFDLEDCDRILRIKCANAMIQPSCLIDFLQKSGIEAEVLPDE